MPISLETEQKELLMRLVEAVRSVPGESRRSFLVIYQMAGVTKLQGNGLDDFPVLRDDLTTLSDAGLIRPTNHNEHGGISGFILPPEAFDYYSELRSESDDQAGQVEEEILHYLTGADFQSRYPQAFARWREAAELLWKADGSDELSTIGHKCREAVQDFVTELLQRQGVAPKNPDPARTRDRLSEVVDTRRVDLGDRKAELLDALFNYWKAACDLIQRQEHAGQRQDGEPLTWEDGRRVVFQTAVVMFEIDRTLSRFRSGTTLRMAPASPLHSSGATGCDRLPSWQSDRAVEGGPVIGASPERSQAGSRRRGGSDRPVWRPLASETSHALAAVGRLAHHAYTGHRGLVAASH